MEVEDLWHRKLLAVDYAPSLVLTPLQVVGSRVLDSVASASEDLIAVDFEFHTLSLKFIFYIEQIVNSILN